MLYKSILALFFFQATYSRPFLGSEVSFPRALDDILPTDPFSPFDDNPLPKVDEVEGITITRLDDDFTRLVETLQTTKREGGPMTHTSDHTKTSATATSTPRTTSAAHSSGENNQSSTSDVDKDTRISGTESHMPAETARGDVSHDQVDQNGVLTAGKPAREINRWKVIGIAVLTVTFVVVVVLGAVFFDTLCRFLKDVFCGRKKDSGDEDFIPDWATRTWDKGSNPILIRDLSEQFEESKRRSLDHGRMKYGPEFEPHPLEPLVRRPSNRMQMVPPIVVHHCA